MKLGLATSVLVHYEMRGAIEAVASAGYDGIDIWGGRPHVYRCDYSTAELRNLRRLIDDCGLQVSSFMPAFYRYPHSLSSPSRCVREDSLDYMRQCIDNAVELGSPLVLVVPGRSVHGQTPDQARELVLGSIRTLSEFAGGLPLKLGIEPANRAVSDLVNTGAEALAMALEVGGDNLGVVLDSGHMLLVGEDVPGVIRRLGAKLLQMHVNDNDGVRQQNLVPGDGVFDFRQLVDVLAQNNYDGFLSAELSYEYSSDPMPPMCLARQRLAAMLGSRAPS